MITTRQVSGWGMATLGGLFLAALLTGCAGRHENAAFRNTELDRELASSKESQHALLKDPSAWDRERQEQETRFWEDRRK